MTAHYLCNLLNELRKTDKIRGYAEHFIAFLKKLKKKFNNTEAGTNGTFQCDGSFECPKTNVKLIDKKMFTILSSILLLVWIYTCIFVGSFSLPFLNEAHQQCTDLEALSSLDFICEACMSNHVAKRASTRQVRHLPLQSFLALYKAK